MAEGHIAALEYIIQQEKCGCKTYNLGTGVGYTVLEVVKAMEKACGKPIPLKFEPRRGGDVAVLRADPSKAKEDLGWEAKYTLDDMCSDLWRFQTQNIDGFL